MSTTRTKLPLAKPEQFVGATLMRITESNVKRVRYIDISLDRPLTVIGGDNAQGKTSFLDGIEWGLGKKAAIQMDPIHHGKQQGSVALEFGDGRTVSLKVTRTLKRVGDSEFTADIDLEIPGHVAPSRVEEFLAAIRGDLAVDPMAFDWLKPAEQLLQFRKLVVGFDFDANKKAHDDLYAQRTQVNHDRKNAQAAADAIDILDKPPGERIDEAALTAELQSAGEKNLDIERRKSNREKAVARIADLHALAMKRADDSAEATSEMYLQIELLHARITAEEQARDADVSRINSEAKELQAKLDTAEPLPEPIDASAITAQLTEARRINRLIDDWETQRARRDGHQRFADQLSAESDELTAKLAALEQAKCDAIRKAHLPIDGIGFGDGFVTLHGVPLEQASEAQRIDAYMALAIALQPKLRFILLRHASGVGSKIRQRIQERAAELGYRVLMEVCDETGANSHVFIEDGVVKKLDGVEIATPVEQPPEQPALELTAPATATDEAQAARRTRKPWQGPGAPTGERA